MAQPIPQRIPSVSHETTQRLELFAGLVARWGHRLNLLAAAELARLWERHILDAAQLVDTVPTATREAVDIGTGAGFPGLVLAIVAGIPYKLVESDRRKAAFLREAIRVTQAPASVAACRVETLCCRADLVTARAVAPLRDLLALAHPLLASGGHCLFLKGQAAANEVAAAMESWQMTLREVPSLTSDDASVLLISSLRRR